MSERFDKWAVSDWHGFKTYVLPLVCWLWAWGAVYLLYSIDFELELWCAYIHISHARNRNTWPLKRRNKIIIIQHFANKEKKTCLRNQICIRRELILQVKANNYCLIYSDMLLKYGESLNERWNVLHDFICAFKQCLRPFYPLLNVNLSFTIPVMFRENIHS